MSSDDRRASLGARRRCPGWCSVATSLLLLVHQRLIPESNVVLVATICGKGQSGKKRGQDRDLTLGIGIRIIASCRGLRVSTGGGCLVRVAATILVLVAASSAASSSTAASTLLSLSIC